MARTLTLGVQSHFVSHEDFIKAFRELFKVDVSKDVVNPIVLKQILLYPCKWQYKSHYNLYHELVTLIQIPKQLYMFCTALISFLNSKHV